jgi:hypothetical protein
MAHVTVKRQLEASDWMTLGPCFVIVALWVLFKGLRYVP